MKISKHQIDLQSIEKVVQAHYKLEPIKASRPLMGGEWKSLWRLDGERTAYVLCICHPTTTTASIAYEHRLLAFLHKELPQIPAPILAQDGSSYFIEQGRIVSLLPLMPGEMADNDAAARLPAARFLAQFHRLGTRYPDPSPRPDVPAWHEWDWCAAEWSMIEAALASSPSSSNPFGQRFWQATGKWATQIIAHRAQIMEERSHFQQWIANLAHSERTMTVAPLHDDYHGNNLLMMDDQVTALLDWDSCHPDWLVWDLSNAMWEFCQSEDDAHSLNVSAAREFLHAYTDAGGPIQPHEYEMIIPLIRARRMIEVLSSLRGIVTGTDWDESPDYLLHNLIALENLRSVNVLA